MLKAVIFGAGTNGKNIYERVKDKYIIEGFIDDDSSKWGGSLFGLPIDEPRVGLDRHRVDHVLLASAIGVPAMTARLAELGISESQTITFYADSYVETRRLFLRDFAKTIYRVGDDGECAEAGVYTGEFSKWINTYFPDRPLHLFDTFDGFDPRDVAEDQGRSDESYLKRMTSVFSETSEDLVMSKMPHPKMVRIHKGCFPESAEGKGFDSKRFCFVNLDMDLYQPTYAGLCFFFDKLTPHGIILVHDYWSDVFQGAREAVDRFVREMSPQVRIAPIGDEFSIMLLRTERQV